MEKSVYHIVNVYVKEDAGLKRYDEEYIVKSDKGMEDLRKEMKQRFNTDDVHFTYEKI